MCTTAKRAIKILPVYGDLRVRAGDRLYSRAFARRNQSGSVMDRAHRQAEFRSEKRC